MNHRATSPALRILCVCPLFPPAAHAEAFVAAKWTLALIARGVDMTVLSEPGATGSSETSDRSRLWTPLEGRVFSVEAPTDSRFFESLRLGLRYRVGRLYPRWVDRVVRRAVELDRDAASGAFNLVVSRSLPMRAHVAGYWCARALDVPWVANLDDPWDLHLFPGRVKRVARDLGAVSNRWLRRTLRSADVVTGPCARLNDYNRRLARSSGRIEVVPHVGVAAPDARVTEFRLVHAGALGREQLTGGRPATGLLTGLARFLAKRPDARATTRLRLVGPEDPDAQALATRLGLSDVVQFPGRLSYEQSLGEIAAAAVCVLVEAPMEEGIYLPSKFADYAAAAKPVLALSPRVGTVADFAGDPGVLRADVDDEADIARALEELHEGWRKDALASRRPSEGLQGMFRARSVADAFLAAVSGAVSPT